MIVFFCSVLPNEIYFPFFGLYIFIFILFLFFFFTSSSDFRLNDVNRFYIDIGLSYFFVFFIINFFLFFTYLTYSPGFSMRSYFCSFSLIKIQFL